MASRRSLTTTTAVAGAVLVALCFMPSASASPAHTSGAAAGTTPSSAAPAGAYAATGRTAQATGGLADTGAVDTTPYVVGGAGFLGVGAALLLGSRRRAALAVGA